MDKSTAEIKFARPINLVRFPTLGVILAVLILYKIHWAYV